LEEGFPLYSLSLGSLCCPPGAEEDWLPGEGEYIMSYGREQVTLKQSQFVNFGSVQMIYRGNGSAQIRGRVTGHVYQFPRQQPVQAVDPRDAVELIRTRLFSPVL
jgi:hypothetical protein